MTRLSIKSAAVAALMLAAAPSAFACACCAVPGVWGEVRSTMSEYETSVVGEMTLANGAIELPGLETSVSVGPAKFAGKTLTLKGAGGELLTFTQSGKLTHFRSDISFITITDPQQALASPELYHEWRLEGTMTRAGLSGVSARKQKATLILKGTGNLCLEAPNFSTWTLKPKAAATEFLASGTVQAK